MRRIRAVTVAVLTVLVGIVLIWSVPAADQRSASVQTKGTSTTAVEPGTATSVVSVVPEPSTTTTQAVIVRAAAAPVTTTTKEVREAPPGPSEDVWVRLAECESGMTNANTGNGYYGYFQFLPSTWRSVGGTGLPTDHGWEEQRARAQILQERSGWGQWPACSRKLGLR